MINSSTLSGMILPYIVNIVADDDLVIPESRENMVLLYIHIYILVMSYQQMINSSTLSCLILAYIVNIVADDDLGIPESREL